MIEITVNKNEAGQRFDKYLFKYFKNASPGFIYKMIRKKNIVLNDQKATGREKITLGDTIKIYMKPETIDKFKGEGTGYSSVDYSDLKIIYEDKDLLFIDKPQGMLSQKAKQTDISANEKIISYLVEEGKLTRDELNTFHPSVCNRLDRNTSGLLAAGKSLYGLQVMSSAIKEKSTGKIYLAVVKGRLDFDGPSKAYLTKDELGNVVHITDNFLSNSSVIANEFTTLDVSGDISLIQIKLITGKTHQIRAHLAHLGHPVLGDPKYGDYNINKKYNINKQVLHSYKMIFSKEFPIDDLAGKIIRTDIPEEISRLFSKAKVLLH